MVFGPTSALHSPVLSRVKSSSLSSEIQVEATILQNLADLYLLTYLKYETSAAAFSSRHGISQSHSISHFRNQFVWKLKHETCWQGIAAGAQSLCSIMYNFSEIRDTKDFVKIIVCNTRQGVVAQNFSLCWRRILLETNPNYWWVICGSFP